SVLLGAAATGHRAGAHAACGGRCGPGSEAPDAQARSIIRAARHAPIDAVDVARVAREDATLLVVDRLALAVRRYNRRDSDHDEAARAAARREHEKRSRLVPGDRAYRA